MKKTYMRHKKDCMQAVLATLLSVEYEEIPEFYLQHEAGVKDFDENLDSWLHARGFFRIEIDTPYNKEPLSMPYVSLPSYVCIGVLYKQGRNYSHVVVLIVSDLGVRVYHDPKEGSEYTIEDLIRVEFVLKTSEYLQEVVDQ